MAAEFCTALFARQRVESAALICLDTKKQVIATETLSEGTINETPLYIRSIVECALRHKSHTVLLAHNHPTGDTTPSPADIAMTSRARAALAVLEIDLIDHIIVAGKRYSSLARLNLMDGGSLPPILQVSRNAAEEEH